MHTSYQIMLYIGIVVYAEFVTIPYNQAFFSKMKTFLAGWGVECSNGLGRTLVYKFHYVFYTCSVELE